jgi:hypothetical protein
MSAIVHDGRVDTATLDLTTLRHLSYQELDELYRAATPPRAISDVDGHARGAMLAWRHPQSGPLAWLLRTFGGSTAFPWEGKSFEGERERGKGINRVTFFGKRRWFSFKTRFDASFVDGKPTFVLDYSSDGNPPMIRSIVDEIREVAPGLYLGPAAILIKGRPRKVLFFAVSHQED